jgi:tRNA (cmo5U34)-methyltransferase
MIILFRNESESMTEINKNESSWQFDESVAPVFESHVRSSVPMYDAFHDLVANLSSYFVESNSNVFDLGTSTGEAIKRVQQKNSHKENVKYIGYDNSEAMIAEAYKSIKNIDFYVEDLTDDGIYLLDGSFMSSVLTMQFVPLSKRQKVLNNVFDGLNQGGAFVMIEKVIASHPVFEQIFSTEYENFKHEQGLSEEHIFKKKQSLKGVMRPLTDEHNRAMLRSAGFTQVETFFKHNNFAGYIAIK